LVQKISRVVEKGIFLKFLSERMPLSTNQAVVVFNVATYVGSYRTISEKKRSALLNRIGGLMGSENCLVQLREQGAADIDRDVCPTMPWDAAMDVRMRSDCWCCWFCRFCWFCC